MIEFTKDDYWEIWQIAHRKYLEQKQSHPNSEVHLAKIYSDAVLAYLKFKNYDIVKKTEDIKYV